MAVVWLTAHQVWAVAADATGAREGDALKAAVAGIVWCITISVHREIARTLLRHA